MLRLAASCREHPAFAAHAAGAIKLMSILNKYS